MLILLVLASIKIASVTMIFSVLLNLEVHLFLLSLPRSRSAPTNGGSSTLIGLTSQIDVQASSLAETEVTYTVCCIISLGEISGNLGILLEVDVSGGFGILLDFVLCLRLSITLRSSCNFFRRNPQHYMFPHMSDNFSTRRVHRSKSNNCLSLSSALNKNPTCTTLENKNLSYSSHKGNKL